MAAVTNKRKRVDLEGQDYQGPKRQKIILNKNLRASVLQAILYGHIRICKELKVEEYSDLCLSEQITASLLNAHNCLRQGLNSSGGLNQKVQATTFNYYDGAGQACSVPVAKERIEEIWKMCLRLVSLEYSKGAEWIGIASPMFAFIVGFKARRQELRIGTSDLPTTKSRASNVTTLQTIPISEYGLNQAHGVFLEGITYPPNLKSMMAQSLGPMTSLIMLSRSGSGIYSNKWEEAVLRDFMNFPDIAQCVSLVKSNPASQTRQLFRLLADILLITGSRAANRMFFPGFCLVMVLLHEETRKAIAAAKETNGSLGTIAVKEPTIPWKDDLSFSGARGFEIYQALCSYKWTLRVPGECTNVSLIKQVFFHSVFGTYKEDLGILKWMVEGEPTFLNRKKISSVFGKSEKQMEFIPLKLKRWSKLVSAQQTDFLGTSSSTVAPQSTLSGKRTRNWGDAFFKHLDSDSMTGGYVQVRNITGMVGQYTTLLNKLRTQLERNSRKAVVGSVSWFTFNKSAEGKYVPEEEIPVETGEFFVDNRE